VQRLLAGEQRPILSNPEFRANRFENRRILRPYFPPRAVNYTNDRPASVVLVKRFEFAVNHLEQLFDALGKVRTRDGALRRNVFQDGNVLLITRNVVQMRKSPTRFDGTWAKRRKNVSQIELKSSRPTGFSAITNDHSLHCR